MPNNNIKKIGLTGNIASGKSAVLDLFKKNGCHTISMDEVAHQLLDSNERIIDDIRSDFGEEVFGEDGTINRSRLADIVFNNKQLLKDLELILHPEIEKVVTEEIGSLPAGTIVVIEVPLLFEAGWDTKMDHNLLIKCPVETRIERYIKNGAYTAEDFGRREATQWSEEKKEQLATDTIDNSQDLAKTEVLVKKFVDSLEE